MLFQDQDFLITEKTVNPGDISPTVLPKILHIFLIAYKRIADNRYKARQP